MTGEQIIEVIKETGARVEDLAFGSITVPDDFKLSEENQKLVDEKEALWQQIKNHPDYSKRQSEYGPELSALIEVRNNIPNEYRLLQNEYLESLGIGEMKEIEQVGGEGEGRVWYSVQYFPKHDVYIRIDGYYESYNGTDFNGWEDVSVVRPTEKTITVYE